MKEVLKQLQTLTQHFEQTVAAEDYAAAELALLQLEKHFTQLPDGWQNDDAIKTELLRVQETLTTYRQALQQAKDTAKDDISRLGKSKKGVKAYTK